MSATASSTRRRDLLLLGGLAVGLIAIAWLAGFLSSLLLDGGSPSVPQGVQAPGNFGLYDEAWSHVDREFYGETPEPLDVAHGAVVGLIEAVGDPHAAFVSAAASADELPDFQPQFVETLGLWTEHVVGGLAVLSVVPHSQGAEAGIAAGDAILAIDQTALGSMERQEMIDTIRGESGETSVLIVRDAEGVPQTVEITRTVTSRPTSSLEELESGVFHLRIPEISPEALSDVDETLATLSDAAASRLIVDLRDNPGGDLNTFSRLAGRFFDGTAWLEVGAEGVPVQRNADRDGAPSFAPPDHVVVLVNDGTVGEAEMLAAALRDRLDAELVGTHTYGRDMYQDWVQLSDGSHVRLSVGRWRTPSGSIVDDAGLAPDREVDGDDEQLKAALRAAGDRASATGG